MPVAEMDNGPGVDVTGESAGGTSVALAALSDIGGMLGVAREIETSWPGSSSMLIRSARLSSCSTGVGVDGTISDAVCTNNGFTDGLLCDGNSNLKVDLRRDVEIWEKRQIGILQCR